MKQFSDLHNPALTDIPIKSIDIGDQAGNHEELLFVPCAEFDLKAELEHENNDMNSECHRRQDTSK